MWTWWELYGNTLGTREENKKKSLFPLSKRKKLDRSWVHAEPSHWLHEISLSKIVHHHFPSGLIPPIINNWGYLLSFILISSWVRSQLFYLFSLKGPYWLAHHQIFWNIGQFHIEAPLYTAGCKIKTNMLNLDTWELNFGQTIWDKTEVLLRIFWGTTWELGQLFGNLMGTNCEHDGN